jgi:hypothetical protein
VLIVHIDHFRNSIFPGGMTITQNSVFFFDFFIVMLYSPVQKEWDHSGQSDINVTTTPVQAYPVFEGSPDESNVKTPSAPPIPGQAFQYHPEDVETLRPASEYPTAPLLSNESQCNNHLPRIRYIAKLYQIILAIEIILAIITSRYYGASILIGFIFVAFFHSMYFFVNLSSGNPYWHMSIHLILNLLECVFVIVFFTNAYRITGCIKYAFSDPGSSSFTGDSNYFSQTEQCAKESGDLFWECYCYNAYTKQCITTSSSSSESSSADKACGGIISPSPTLAVILLVIVLLHTLPIIGMSMYSCKYSFRR